VGGLNVAAQELTAAAEAAEPEGAQGRVEGRQHGRPDRQAEMTALVGRIRDHARHAMRSQIAQRQAAGVPLFTDHQLGVLHQQLRDRRAVSPTAT
jgi:hypothetical protein